MFKAALMTGVTGELPGGGQQPTGSLGVAADVELGLLAPNDFRILLKVVSGVQR